MRTHIYLCVICLILFLVISCKAGDNEFEDKFNEAMKNEKGLELFNSLLSLDQQYPDKLALKVNIGGMLLASGDMQKASAYLEQGLKLVRKNKDKNLKFLLFTNLAELSYRKKEYKKGLEYADKALGFKIKDKIGVLFTKAKCLLEIGEDEEALKVFQEGWEEQKNNMNREDMNAYIVLLLEQEKYEDVLGVIKQYEAKFGYETNLGIKESAIYEKLGRINEGILAAFKDLEYQRYNGLISSGQQIERLICLEEKLSDTSWNPRKQGKSLIRGLKAYVSGIWVEANSLLTSFKFDEDMEFHRYLVLSSSLEQGNAGIDDLKFYIDLEASFRGLPAYYYHLWQGMKKSEGNYNIGTARNVLEKCILLAPGTLYAEETRIELGRLLGLSKSDGEKILLGHELDAIYRRLSTGIVNILDPVMDLLSTPDNVYQMAAVLMLQEAKKNEIVRAYLEAKRDNASGRLKERLDSILGIEAT